MPSRKKYVSDKSLKNKLEIWLLKDDEIGETLLKLKKKLKFFNFFFILKLLKSESLIWL